MLAVLCDGRGKCGLVEGLRGSRLSEKVGRRSACARQAEKNLGYRRDHVTKLCLRETAAFDQAETTME